MVDSRPPGAPPDGVAGPTGALSAERYLAWLYSPAAMQPVLAALCRLESEVAVSLKPGVDHHVAHSRLQWWREECERTAEGRPVHPLTRELVAAARSPLRGISGFVDTAVWDLASATFETRKELTAYCQRWGTAMFETAASAGGAGTEVSRLGALGAAVREAELLANLALEAHAGRLRVPLDELERADVDTGSLARTPWPVPLATLLRERHEVLRKTIAGEVSRFANAEQASVRGLLVWAVLAWRQSWRAEHALPNEISPRQYHALADGWHAWRAAHRATAGKLRLP
jgi:phytoene synthase